MKQWKLQKRLLTPTMNHYLETGIQRPIVSTDRETAETVLTNLEWGGVPAKDWAYYFNISPPRFTQKIAFWRDTISVLWLVDRKATIVMAMDAAARFATMPESAMTDKQIEIRRRIKDSRFG